MGQVNHEGRYEFVNPLKGLMRERNLSIMAHGFNPIGKKTASAFLKELKALLSMVGVSSELLEAADFPKLPEGVELL